MNGRILVTGGSGFIGTNVVESALRAGQTVLSLDLLKPRNPAHAAHWQHVQLTDREALTKAVREFAPTQIFHLGARTDLDGTTIDDYAANTVGTENLIAAIAESDSLARVIFVSSMLVCRMGYRPRDEFDYCPSTAYGESKVEMEKIIRAADITADWAIVRPTSIWGPWFGPPYNDFFRAVIAGRYVHPRGREVMQSFGFVGNTVYELEALAAADASKINGKTFYLSDYPEIEFGAWADSIAQLAGAKPIRRVPMSLLTAAAKAGDVLQRATGKPMPLTSFRLNNLVTSNVQDLGPLEAVVGELPFTTAQGVSETLEWMRAPRPT